MLQPLLIGVAAGFVTSIGVGPLMLAAISKFFRHGLTGGLAVGTGAAIMDFVVICLVAGGLDVLRFSDSALLILGLSGGMFLIGSGVHSLFLRTGEPLGTIVHNPPNPLGAEPQQFLKQTSVGMLIYASNPVFIALWASVVSFLKAEGFLQSHPVSLLPFAFGASVGTLILFWIALSGVQKLSGRFQFVNTSLRFTSLLDIALGLMIILEVALSHPFLT